ncbi:hypothetical protein ACFL1L_04885 [Thermoplasmatota archaeon]
MKKMIENCICYVCESKFHEEDIKHIKIKGNIKDICRQCVDSINGLI